MTAWARHHPPSDLLELAAQSGGAIVVPTVIVVESTTGRPHEDARINQLLKRVVPDICTLERSRQPAALRFRCPRQISAVDAVAAETAADRIGAWAPDLPGCIALGDTVEETEQEMREAIAFHLDGQHEDGLPVPTPSTVSATVRVTAA